MTPFDFDRKGYSRQKGDLDLHAVLVHLGQAALVGGAAQPHLVAVGPVTHQPQLGHVRPRAPIGAPRYPHLHSRQVQRLQAVETLALSYWPNVIASSELRVFTQRDCWVQQVAKQYSDGFQG